MTTIRDFCEKRACFFFFFYMNRLLYPIQPILLVSILVLFRTFPYLIFHDFCTTDLFLSLIQPNWSMYCELAQR